MTGRPSEKDYERMHSTINGEILFDAARGRLIIRSRVGKKLNTIRTIMASRQKAEDMLPWLKEWL